MWEGIFIHTGKKSMFNHGNVMIIISSFYKIIPVILILLASPLAMCAEVNGSLDEGNRLLSCNLSILITPSHIQASVGDILNISYLVVNKCEFLFMNVSLNTEESGPVLLNESIIPPHHASIGIESIRLNESDFPGPIIRNVRVSAQNLVSYDTVTFANSTSIELRTSGRGGNL
jgi:hypothetical protein